MSVRRQSRRPYIEGLWVASGTLTLALSRERERGYIAGELSCGWGVDAEGDDVCAGVLVVLDG